MLNEKHFQGKLYAGIIALCSSLLTNTLTDFISETDYVITMKNNQITLKNTPVYLSSLILNILQIITIFFIIFILLSSIVKLSSKIYKKIHIQRLKEVNEKELINILYSVTQDSMALYERFSLDTHNPMHDNFIKINLKELNTIILRLNKYFSRPTSQEIQKIKCLIRKAGSSCYITSITSISSYELEGIFNLLQFMLDETMKISSNDTLLISDCENMSNILKNLKDSLI